MTAWVLWSWHQPRGEWIEVRCGSEQRMKELAAERQTQAEAVPIPYCMFVALPAKAKPWESITAPGQLPGCTGAPVVAESAHFVNCWRHPGHHACAVAKIERLQIDYQQLHIHAAELERAAREHAA
jgi:hypothetical protein